MASANDKKGGTKRPRKVLRDNIQSATRSAVRRLARRGGVKRLSGLVYEEIRGVLKNVLESIVHDSVTYAEHARRKTVTTADVVYALARQDRPIYGFDEMASRSHRSQRDLQAELSANLRAELARTGC